LLLLLVHLQQLLQLQLQLYLQLQPHPTTRKRGEKNEPLCGRGKRGKSNSCLRCWCNDVIAIMSHHVHTRKDGQKNRTTNLLISSNVHYVHLGGDNKRFYVFRTTALVKILRYENGCVDN